MNHEEHEDHEEKIEKIILRKGAKPLLKDWRASAENTEYAEK